MNVADQAIWADNLTAVAAFMAVSSQWRFTPTFGGSPIRTGLDYAGAQSGLALAGIAMTPALWSDVRAIEAGVLSAGNDEMIGDAR